VVATRTRKIAAHLAVLVLLLGVSAVTEGAGEPEQRIVSMVHLLARPSDLDGKIVLVRGYLIGMRLYLTKDHAKIADSASSIPIESPGPEMMKCGDAYVAVNGVFGLRDEYGIVKTLEVARWSDGPVPVSTCWKREGEE
jgi:hypothetical protein